MTIRRRYYLAILPLFLGLALINSALVYYTERSELLWGMQERVQSAAASIVGFWEVIEAPTNGQPYSPLARYGQRLGGLSIVKFDAHAKDWVPQELLTMADLPSPPAPDAQAMLALQNGLLTWTFIDLPKADHDFCVGYAPIMAPGGQLSAVIGVIERNTQFRDTLSKLRLRLAGLTLALLLAGVIAAELISNIASRQLRALTRAAVDASHGQYLTHWPEGRINELNDLGGTLLTMTSLLAAESYQTRRRFFQAEPMPGDADLVAGYRSYLDHALPDSVGSVLCVYRRLGALIPEDFCGWRETETGWHLCIGRCMPAANLSVMERMVRAEATREFLLGVAVSQPSGPTWSYALAALPCDMLTMIQVPASASAASGWMLDAARTGQVLWTSKGLNVFGTLSTDVLLIGQAYANQFQDRPLDHVADELSGLLAGRSQGLLVICDVRAPLARAETS